MSTRSKTEDWAMRLVEDLEFSVCLHGSDVPICESRDVLRVLLAEHRRAVRIVRRAKTAIADPCYRRTEFEQGYMTAIENILRALTRGRRSLFDSKPLSLFDSKPLTIEQVKANMDLNSDGATIRRWSGRGPGQGVLRTVRHKPWWILLGAGPPGATCKSCVFLARNNHSGKYLKCGRQVITNGTGTDIRAKDPACQLYVKKTVKDNGDDLLEDFRGEWAGPIPEPTD